MTPPKTVRVRIAVAVDDKGRVRARVSNGKPSNDRNALLSVSCVGNVVARCWVTADIPIPAPLSVEGSVERAE